VGTGVGVGNGVGVGVGNGVGVGARFRKLKSNFSLSTAVVVSWLNAVLLPVDVITGKPKAVGVKDDGNKEHGAVNVVPILIFG
jgi:hypothetical protein